MLKAPSLCLLDTSLQVNVIDFGNPIQKKEKNYYVIFDQTFTYNSFLPIPTHFTELLQMGIEQVLTLIGIAQPHIVGVMGAMQPSTIGTKQLPIVGTSQLHIVGVVTQLHVLWNKMLLIVKEHRSYKMIK